MVVGWLIVVDFIFMFSSLKDDTSADNPATWCPFLQMDSLAQKLHGSGTPLGQEFKMASASVTTSLSRLVPFRGNISCKLNFRVDMGWAGMDRVEMAYCKRLDYCLYRVRSILHKCH